MNRATLQTYVRSTISTKPQTAEEIFKEIQKENPSENGISLGRINIILEQLHANGKVRKQDMFFYL